MKIVISPAKSLDFENADHISDAALPTLLPQSEKLIKKLKKLSPKKIGSLMGISPKLADINHERFQEWEVPFNDSAKPALSVFTGDVFRGINAKAFSDEERATAQSRLRILSGLYGILKPNDLILPYRLEMGTRFAVTPKVKNLYQFWGDQITNQINQELAEDDGVLVNLASNEYFKSINPKKLKGRIVTCTFKDEKNGEYKSIMTYAKIARGLMTRFIIQNNLTEVEQLKTFDLEGYFYNDPMSTEDNLVFTRG